MAHPASSCSVSIFWTISGREITAKYVLIDAHLFTCAKSSKSKEYKYVWNNYNSTRCNRVILCFMLFVAARLSLPASPNTSTSEEQLVSVLRDILSGNNIRHLCFLEHGNPVAK